MGAQRYEAELIKGVPSAVPDWSVRHLTIRSLRSPLHGDRRLPIGWLTGADVALRRLAGVVAFPDRSAILHRMDLVIPPGPGLNTVTIHDTVSWRYPDESPPIAASAEEARRADAVICVSAFSANDVQRMLGVREPVVVYNGVDDAFFSAPELSSSQRAQLQLHGPYVLHAGGAAERKNLAALAAAWPQIHRQRPDLTLALCGPEHPRRTELFRGLSGVRLLGRQPEGLLPSLVKSAAIVVVPSTDEGFGLPALEAMAAGVPVVAANTSSLPEVVGNTGILVEPTGAGVRDGLLDGLALGSDRAAMVEAAKSRASEFTWQRCVQGHVAVWESLG
jgi:glycosyltransferase involved in cell wall biosynthesis